MWTHEHSVCVCAVVQLVYSMHLYSYWACCIHTVSVFVGGGGTLRVSDTDLMEWETVSIVMCHFDQGGGGGGLCVCATSCVVYIIIMYQY